MSAAERFKYYPPLLSATFPRKYTIEEYLQMVEQTDEKLEYVNGCIVTAEMGGSYSHTLIASNIVALLHTALRGKPCRSHNGDFKIKTKTSFRFADAFVVCGEPQFTSDKKTSLTNPTVLIEVVSPESSLRDYVDKRLEYFEIESLKHYIIIEQNAPAVFVYTKNNDGTLLLTDYDFKKPSIYLPALDISINVNDMYEAVEFGEY